MLGVSISEIIASVARMALTSLPIPIDENAAFQYR
jgi:hypothetical protein